MEDKETSVTTVASMAQSRVVPHVVFSQAVTAKADSSSRRGVFKTAFTRTDDLEELDEDDDGDEMVQDIEPLIDYSDVNDPATSTTNLFTVDWGDLDQEQRSLRKRPALEDLPEDVREELACMSGADTEIRPKQKLKLEPLDTVKESSRERKSPAEDDGASNISLILSRPTKTAEERLAVLEARDKLIRIRSNQQVCTQIKNVGKCPDMCPEKERYQRIARHQVDYYEYNRETKEVNLASMVKIYARSSADQQMPLPHDLRPVNVLWMTMSYLVNQFTDLADSPGENLGEWYHFLWDRMRSIRKDITQLALCDTVSVQILEMCARFHIFCMERLREEKMAVFDEKINRENLTKCLQSLQYMYNDLYLKNISCPNEPEFQAYSILLHINSDLCTSTILGLRPEMRQHVKVQFAINAFLAVTMKNYVRFFKLVKSTSYLNACILHQYFAQVRAHAMHSIIRAYSRQKMRNTYPLSELQVQLLFDSINDVLEFCRFSNVPVEENNVVLEKKTSHPIPMQEKMKRSFVAVECKRDTSIREIVAGGCQLSDTALFHKVHSSFDEQGVLKQEAWYAEDQETSLSVDMHNTESHPMTDLRSEGSPLILNAGTPLQRSVAASHFMTSDSEQLNTQNSNVTKAQQFILDNAKIRILQNYSSATQHIHEHEEITDSPGDTSDSSALVVMQPDVFRSSTLCEPSHAAIPPSVDAKSFVFRLPEMKTETKSDLQPETINTGVIQSGFATQPMSSIFGSSGMVAKSTTAESSELKSGSSVHIVSTSHTTVQSPFTGKSLSLAQEQSVGIIGTHNLGNVQHQLDLSASNDTLTPQQINSDIFFKNPGFSPFVSDSSTDLRPKSDFWASAKSGSSQSFASPNSSIDSTLAPNQVSDYKFDVTSQSKIKLNERELNDKSLLVKLQCESFMSTSLSPSLESSEYPSGKSHVSPFCSPNTAVTVPTSIFGSHSRPLAVPHMFPVSASQIELNTFSPSASSSIVCEEKCTPDTNIKSTITEEVTLPSTHYASSLSEVPIDKLTGLKIPCIALNKSTSVMETKHQAKLNMSDQKYNMEMEVDSVDQLENAQELISKSDLLKTGLSELSYISTSSKLIEESSPLLKFHQKLNKTKDSQTHELVKEIFQKWRILTYQSKLKQRIVSQEKCTPLETSLSLEEQVIKIPIPQGCVAIDYQTRLEYLLDLQDIKEQYLIYPDIGQIQLENVIPSVLPKALFEKGRMESNMFWKLCISSPDESEGKKFSLQINEWIKTTFFHGSEEESNFLRVKRSHIGDKYTLFSSVQKITYLKESLKGVNGILFFVPRNMVNCENCFERYQRLIKSMLGPFPLPLVAVICNTQWKEVCHKWFSSDVQNGKLASFNIIGPFHEKEECVFKELIASILWMAQHISPIPSFEHTSLGEMLQTTMSDLWTHVRFSLSSRCSSGFQQHPADLLGLYHEALTRLQKIFENDEPNKYFNIAPELEELAKQTLQEQYINEMPFKDFECLKKIRNAFSQLHINVCISYAENVSVESLCKAICSYNSRLQGPILHFLCSQNENDDIDWTCIIEALTDFHIRDTIGNLKLRKLSVYVLRSEINKFCMEPWYTHWLQDRIPYSRGDCGAQRHDESPADTLEGSLSVSDKDDSWAKDDKLLSDFESMLNELEKLNEGSFNLNSLEGDVFVSPSSDNRNNMSIKLDMFESQLEYYASLLKD